MLVNLWTKLVGWSQVVLHLLEAEWAAFQKWDTKDKIAALALLVAFLAFLINFRQSKRTAQSLSASALSKFYDRLAALNKLEIDHPDLFNGLRSHYDPQAESSSLTHYAFMVVNLHEELFYQHKQYGLVSKDFWEAWVSRMRRDMSKQFIREMWRHELSAEYPRAFRRFVNLKVLPEVGTRVKKCPNCSGDGVVRK